MKEARTHFDQTEPETTLQRAIRHKLKKSINRQHNQTPTQTENSHQQVDASNTNQNNIQTHTDTIIQQDTLEHSLRYADIPEEALRMIQRNKQISFINEDHTQVTNVDQIRKSIRKLEG